MAAFYLLPDDYDDLLWFTANTTTTISGTVRAPNGAALRRNIYIYTNLSPFTAVAVIQSDATTGIFSTTVSASPTTEFMVVCIGEEDEDSMVFSHANATTVDESPILTDLAFIMGDDSSTSPYVNIRPSAPEISGTMINPIMMQGNVAPPGDTIMSGEMVVTAIFIGNITPTAPTVYGVCENPTLMYANIIPHNPKVSGEAVIPIIMWGDIKPQKPTISGYTTWQGDVKPSAPQMSGLMLNPAIFTGGVAPDCPKISGSGSFTQVWTVNIEAPLPSISGQLIMWNVLQGSLAPSAPTLSGTLIPTLIFQGSISPEAPRIAGALVSAKADETIAYDRYYRCQL